MPTMPSSELSAVKRPSESVCILHTEHDGRQSRAWHSSALFCRLRVLIRSFRATLEALQRIIDAGSDSFLANGFEHPAPPAWWEDEVSAILDAAGGRVDGSAGDVWFLLQSKGEKHMQVDLMQYVVDRFDLEEEAPGATQGFPGE